MAESNQPPDSMEQIFQNIETEVRIAEDLQSIDSSLLRPNNGFKSAIKYFGSPILPPLMTSMRREEMCMYRRQAVMAETQFRARARQKLLAKVQSVMEEIERRHTPAPPSAAQQGESVGALPPDDSGISSKQQGAQPGPETAENTDTMNDITDLSSEGREEDEVPHLPLDGTDGETELPGDSVADSGVAQSGEADTPREMSTITTDTLLSESDPAESPAVPDSPDTETASQPTRIPVAIKSKNSLTKATVYSSSSGTVSSEEINTVSSEEMNRTVIEKDEDSGSEAQPTSQSLSMTGEFDVGEDLGIPRQAILKHDMEVLGHPGVGQITAGDWQNSTGSTMDSGKLRASLLDRVDLVDEEWSEEGAVIEEIDSPDPDSPKADAQTQAGPSQSVMVEIKASPSSAFQAVKPSVRAEGFAGFTSAIIPRAGALTTQAPTMEITEPKPSPPKDDERSLPSDSEDRTQMTDSMFYTESTELAPYMAASCVVTDDTLDTLPHIPELGASLPEQGLPPPDQHHGPNVLIIQEPPVLIEEESEESPVQPPEEFRSDDVKEADVHSAVSPDPQLKSPPAVHRVRRGSYTLDHPSPALAATTQDNSTSDHSKAASSGKSKSASSVSVKSNSHEDGAAPAHITGPAEKHTTDKPGFPLTSSMEDLQLKLVQRKLDYDESSSTQEVPVKKTVKTDKKKHGTASKKGKPKTSTPEEPQAPQNPAGRPDLSETVGSEQEGKQEHLAKYLEHLGQMPLSSPSTDSPRYSAPPSAERNPQLLQPTYPAEPNQSQSNTSMSYNLAQGYPANYSTYPGMPGQISNPTALPSSSYTSLPDSGAGMMSIPSLSDPDLDLLQLQAQQFDLMRRQMMQQQQQQIAHLLAEQERQQLFLQQELITQQLAQRGKTAKRHSDGKSSSQASSIVSQPSSMVNPAGSVMLQNVQQSHELLHSQHHPHYPGPQLPTFPEPGHIDYSVHHPGNLDYSHLSLPSVPETRPQTAPAPKVSFNLDSSQMSADDTNNASYVDLQSPAVIRTKQTTVSSDISSPRQRSVVSHNIASPEVLSRISVHLDPKTIPPEFHRKFDKVSALIKGHLTRMLMKSDRVQQIIKTIKDTAEFAINFIQESPIKKGVYSAQDRNLQGRVLAQLTAAMYEFHEVFFEISARERISIIHQSRMAEEERARAAQGSRSTSRLSAATLKAQERRKKAQAVETSLYHGQRPKSAPPPKTSSPRHDRKQDSILGGPLRRNYQFLMNRAVRPNQSQISPIKPIKDNLNRAVAKKTTTTAKKTTAKTTTTKTVPSSAGHAGKVTKTTKTMVRNTSIQPRKVTTKKSPQDSNRNTKS